MKELVSSVISTLQPEISMVRPRITIGTLPPTNGVAIQFENVFSNLIRNALNYRSHERPLEIEINGHESESHCEYVVKDNGRGIPNEHLNGIFDLFKRVHADDDHPGNGMGLAYCKKVIDLIGGKIWVESTVNHGSTFRFSVPRPMAPSSSATGN